MRMSSHLCPAGCCSLRSMSRTVARARRPWQCWCSLFWGGSAVSRRQGRASTAGLLLFLWAVAMSQGARAFAASVALELSLSWAALGSQGAKYCFGPESDLELAWMATNTLCGVASLFRF